MANKKHEMMTDFMEPPAIKNEPEIMTEWSGTCQRYISQ